MGDVGKGEKVAATQEIVGTSASVVAGEREGSGSSRVQNELGWRGKGVAWVVKRRAREDRYL